MIKGVGIDLVENKSIKSLYDIYDLKITIKIIIANNNNYFEQALAA